MRPVEPHSEKKSREVDYTHINDWFDHTSIQKEENKKLLLTCEASNSGKKILVVENNTKHHWYKSELDLPKEIKDKLDEVAP
jgi:hypothetical protein